MSTIKELRRELRKAQREYTDEVNRWIYADPNECYTYSDAIIKALFDSSPSGSQLITAIRAAEDALDEAESDHIAMLAIQGRPCRYRAGSSSPIVPGIHLSWQTGTDENDLPIPAAIIQDLATGQCMQVRAGDVWFEGSEEVPS